MLGVFWYHDYAQEGSRYKFSIFISNNVHVKVVVQKWEIFSFLFRLMCLTAAFPWVGAPEWKKNHVWAPLVGFILIAVSVQPVFVSTATVQMFPPSWLFGKFVSVLNVSAGSCHNVWKPPTSSSHSSSSSSSSICLFLAFSGVCFLFWKEKKIATCSGHCMFCFMFLICSSLVSARRVWQILYSCESARRGVQPHRAERNFIASDRRSNTTTVSSFLSLFSLVIDERCDWLLCVKWRYINWNIALGRQYAVQAHRAILLLMLRLTLYNTHNPLGVFF